MKFKPDNPENSFFRRLALEEDPKNLMRGKVLISEPFLADPNFSRTVVALAEYNKKEGAFGFIINKPTKLSMDSIAPDFSKFNFPFYQGGPVEPNQLFYMHNAGEKISESREFLPGLYWSGSYEEIVNRVAMGQMQPTDIKFFGGYSGWSPGQLEQEIKDQSWIISRLSAEDILSLPSEQLWKKSLKNLGDKYSVMANFPVDPMWN